MRKIVKKRFTVTIGIPAHNEAGNISRLLDSIFAQKLSSGTIESVLIMCDNCTDGTQDVVRAFQTLQPKLRLIDSKRRIGKIGVMNRLRKASDSDVFVSLDADVILAHRQVIEELIRPFSNPDICLVGGNDIPAKADTLVGRVVVGRIEFWLNVCRAINNGITVHNHPGRINALRKKFYRKLVTPEGFFADDDFQYFMNKKFGFGFAFAKKAVAIYKAPNTMVDFVKQFTRFIKSEAVIGAEFGVSAVNEYAIPVRLKLIGFAKSFIKQPVLMLLVVATQMYLVVREMLVKKETQSGWWETVKSTK